MISLLTEFEKEFKQGKGGGYDKLSPIPSVYDRIISNLVNAYIVASAEDRRFIRDTISHEYSFTLLFFGERMASLAVRTRSEKYIFEGLIAHAIEGGEIDWRDNILIISLLYHSAVKIGVEPNALFQRVADLADEPIAGIIREFPNRKPEDRSIRSMGYIESEDDDGFLYKRVW